MKINTNIIKLVLLVLIILLISNCNNKPLNLNLKEKHIKQIIEVLDNFLL